VAVIVGRTPLASLGRERLPYGRIVIVGVVALLAALAPPTLAVAALGGLGVGALLLARPEVALYLLVFAVPYETLANIHAGSFNVTVTEFIAFCGGAAFLTHGAIAGRFSLRWGWWRLPILLFLAVTCLSVTQATDLALSLKEVLKLSELLLTYLLALSYIDSPARLRRLLLLVALAALSQALLGLAQTFAHFGPASFLRGGALRASGTFAQPNPFAGYLNLTLPLALAGMIVGVDIFGRLTKPLVVIVGAAVLVSQSKGALLAIIVALAVMLIVYARPTRPLIGAAAAAVFAIFAGAVFGIVPSAVTNGGLSVVGLDNVDVANPTPATWANAERLAHQLTGLHMFFDHPLLGVGIGNYPAAYAHYRVAPVWVNDLGHAHNYYINVAAEAGIVGLAAFLIMFIAAFVIVGRLYRRAADPTARAIALGALGVLVTVAVHNNVDNIFVHAMEAQLALVVGIATVACRMSLANSDPRADADPAPAWRTTATTVGGRSNRTHPANAPSP